MTTHIYAGFVTEKSTGDVDFFTSFIEHPADTKLRRARQWHEGDTHYQMWRVGATERPDYQGGEFTTDLAYWALVEHAPADTLAALLPGEEAGGINLDIVKGWFASHDTEEAWHILYTTESMDDVEPDTWATAGVPPFGDEDAEVAAKIGSAGLRKGRRRGGRVPTGAIASAPKAKPTPVVSPPSAAVRPGRGRGGRR